MFGLGSQELLLILVIVLILFGGSRLPDLARSLGASVREFKNGMNAGKSDPDGATEADANTASTAAGVCRSCAADLATDWSHCPRCGTAVADARLAPKNGAARDV